MKKLQLFYIYKFNIERLKEYNYDITITIDEARKNGELVSVGDSQLLRSVRKITKSKFSEEILENLEKEKKELKKTKPTKIIIKNILKKQNEIDKILHIPEIISIIVNNKEDYKKILKNGLLINNINYVRLMCGAGHARKNTVIMCSENIEKEIKKILQNGMGNIKISPSKYNAYFSLSSSSTYSVSSPRVCVIPDKLVTKYTKVDWVEEYDDGDTVEEKNIPIEFNYWDGMGIISPIYARKWAKELGINDYIPSAFTIRNIFVKGMVCTTRFHAFAKLIAKKYNAINDVWGNPIKDIRKYDMILTESQFKLWKAFESWDSFENNCKKNELTWGIAKVTPKEEKNLTSTNYQFIQAINLDDDSIKSLCQPTITWFKDICGLDIIKSLLFLSGNSLENVVDDKNILDINKINNVFVKALLLNNNLINDPYIKNKIYSLLNKKIKKACIGKLLIDGNFQVMISDPYAFCEYLFGMEVNGLLEEKQYYSNYWNQKNVKMVVAMRSPLTWRSEVNNLNLQENEIINKWFKYLKSGIVYPIHGVDCMIAADSDFDFDIVMTTNSEEFCNNYYGGLPVTYKKNLTPKSELNEDLLYLSDIFAFNSKIGQVTNYSTAMYCMLAEYKENSDEYKELIKRLKVCRKEQGSQIDKAKGLFVKKFPKTWIKKQDILKTDTKDIIEKKEFMNKLVIKKKPYFMRWLYDNYNSKYNKYVNNANTYCSINFGLTLNELINKESKTEAELKYLKEYDYGIPLNTANCIMNKLSLYMENIKFDIKNLTKEDNFDYTILLNRDINIDENDKIYKDIINIYKNFSSDTHLHMVLTESEKNGDSEIREELEQNDADYLKELYKYYETQLLSKCSNIDILTNIIVDICYRKHKNYNKDFLWNICEDGLIKNIMRNKQDIILIPVKNKNGYIEYLSEKYNVVEVNIIEDIK